MHALLPESLIVCKLLLILNTLPSSSTSNSSKANTFHDLLDAISRNFDNAFIPRQKSIIIH